MNAMLTENNAVSYGFLGSSSSVPRASSWLEEWIPAFAGMPMGGWRCGFPPARE